MCVRCDKLIDKRIIDDVYKYLRTYTEYRYYTHIICVTGDGDRQLVNLPRVPDGGHFLLLDVTSVMSFLPPAKSSII